MYRYSKVAVRVRIPYCSERLFFFALFYSGRKTKFLFCTLMPKKQVRRYDQNGARRVFFPMGGSAHVFGPGGAAVFYWGEYAFEWEGMHLQ